MGPQHGEETCTGGFENVDFICCVYMSVAFFYMYAQTAMFADMTRQTATSGLEFSRPAVEVEVSYTARTLEILYDIKVFNDHMDARRYNEAEKLFEDLLVVWHEIADIVGHDDDQIIMLVGNLGYMHLHPLVGDLVPGELMIPKRNYTAAVELLAWNLPHRQARFGRSDMRTLVTEASLAIAMFYENFVAIQKGRAAPEDTNFIPMMKETVATMTEFYGKKHDTIVFTNHLVIMLFEDARYDEAANLHRDVSKLANETLGLGHPTSIWIHNTHS
jgi:hypothetical protein